MDDRERRGHVCGGARPSCRGELGLIPVPVPGPGLWSPRRAWHSFYGSNVTESNGVEVMGSASAGSISLLQAMADPVRWTVLAMLAEAPRCVCKLQEQVPIAGNLLSYHLKVLRDAGLVTTTRRGRWVDYALADDAPKRMRAALPGAQVSVTVTV